MNEQFERKLEILKVLRANTYVQIGDRRETIAPYPEAEDNSFEEGFQYLEQIIEFAITKFPHVDCVNLIRNMQIICKEIGIYSPDKPAQLRGELAFEDGIFKIYIPSEMTANITMTSKQSKTYLLSFLVSFAHEFRHAIWALELDQEFSQVFKWSIYGFQKVADYADIEAVNDESELITLRKSLWRLFGGYVYDRSPEERSADEFTFDCLDKLLSSMEFNNNEDIYNSFVRPREKYRGENLFLNLFENYLNKVAEFLKGLMLKFSQDFNNYDDFNQIISRLNILDLDKEQLIYLYECLIIVAMDINQIVHELTSEDIPEAIIPQDEKIQCLSIIIRSRSNLKDLIRKMERHAYDSGIELPPNAHT